MSTNNNSIASSSHFRGRNPPTNNSDAVLASGIEHLRNRLKFEYGMYMTSKVGAWELLHHPKYANYLCAGCGATVESHTNNTAYRFRLTTLEVVAAESCLVNRANWNLVQYVSTPGQHGIPDTEVGTVMWRIDPSKLDPERIDLDPGSHSIYWRSRCGSCSHDLWEHKLVNGELPSYRMDFQTYIPESCLRAQGIEYHDGGYRTIRAPSNSQASSSQTRYDGSK
jgi:hypothetical protein